MKDRYRQPLKYTLAGFLLLLITGAFPDSCRAQNGYSCDLNTFWAILPNGEVMEFELSGNQVLQHGIVVSSFNPIQPSGCLAFANDISGGNYSPTFFTSNLNSAGYRFDGTGWGNFSGSPGCQLFNSAGYGDVLYYNYSGGPPWCIQRFTGNSFLPIYSGNSYQTVADIAIDDQYNFYVMTGALNTITNNILVIDSSGQLIRQYPTLINTTHGYGCFLNEGTLYIGLGASNPVYSNSLLPVYITHDTAMVGIPMPMPSLSFGDLASCNPGFPLGLHEPASAVMLSAYPNPANDRIQIPLPDVVGTGGSAVVLDLSGKVLANIQTDRDAVLTIDTKKLASGFYLCRYIGTRTLGMARFQVVH